MTTAQKYFNTFIHNEGQLPTPKETMRTATTAVLYERNTIPHVINDDDKKYDSDIDINERIPSNLFRMIITVIKRLHTTLSTTHSSTKHIIH